MACYFPRATKGSKEWTTEQSAPAILPHSSPPVIPPHREESLHLAEITLGWLSFLTGTNKNKGRFFVLHTTLSNFASD